MFRIKDKCLKGIWFSCASLATGVLYVRTFFNPKWKSSFSERIAGKNWKFAESPDARGARIWWHAASVGEVGGLVPVVNLVKRQLPLVEHIFSTTSLTGQAEALRRGLGPNVNLLPLDHPWIVRKAIEGSRPSLVVITETEIWPGLLLELQRHQIPVLIINGRISDYSFRSYQRLKIFFAPLLSTITKVLVQSKTDFDRFIAIGVAKERLTICGCSKYDIDDWGESVKTPLSAMRLGLKKGPCFVAGSVRPGELEQVLDAYQLARKAVPDLTIVLAPRHPELFDSAERELLSRGVNFHRRSEGLPTTPVDALLLDTIGELREVYSLASISFVGGTLVDIGGHNPLEPAMKQSPVVVGPFTSNVQEAVDALKQHGAYRLANNSGELATAIESFAVDKPLRDQIGLRAYNAWKSNVGATAKFADEIFLALGHRPVDLQQAVG